MIAEVLGAFKLLFDSTNGALAIWKTVNGKTRKREVGAWLMDLGNLVDEVSKSLEANVYPAAACARMDEILDQFNAVVGKVIEDDRRDRLHRQLDSARNIERLFGEMQSLPDGERRRLILELQTAAGTLQGAGNVLMNM